MESNSCENEANPSLSKEIIKEKIQNVLRFASIPLVEDGTPESLLYQTWHTSYDNMANEESLPADFFSVEHILERERELHSPNAKLLKNLIDLVEQAIPSIKTTRTSLGEGENRESEADLLTTVDHLAQLHWPIARPCDNFGRNSRPPVFVSQFSFPPPSEPTTSNHSDQFDQNPSGLPPPPPAAPITHSSFGNQQYGSQTVRSSSSVINSVTRKL